MRDIHIVLCEPRIPQNTGNIGRLCVAAGVRLHLIHPLGFEVSQKELRRAGMDYWEHLDVREWESLEAFWTRYPFDRGHFLLSTKASKTYYKASFSTLGYPIFLYFGREDRGLEPSLLGKYPNQVYKIPMQEGIRSINLATSVGIVLYEAIRQMEYI